MLLCTRVIGHSKFSGDFIYTQRVGKTVYFENMWWRLSWSTSYSLSYSATRMMEYGCKNSPLSMTTLFVILFRNFVEIVWDYVKISRNSRLIGLMGSRSRVRNGIHLKWACLCISIVVCSGYLHHFQQFFLESEREICVQGTPNNLDIFQKWCGLVYLSYFTVSPFDQFPPKYQAHNHLSAS